MSSDYTKIIQVLKKQTGEEDLPPIGCKKQVRQQIIKKLATFEEEYVKPYNDYITKTNDTNFKHLQQSVNNVSNGQIQQLQKWKNYFENEKDLKKKCSACEILNIVYQLLKWGSKYAWGYCYVSQCLYEKTTISKVASNLQSKIQQINQYIEGKNKGDISLNNNDQNIGLSAILNFIKQKKTAKIGVQKEIQTDSILMPNTQEQLNKNVLQLKQRLQFAQNNITLLKTRNSQKRRKIRQQILNIKENFIQIKYWQDKKKLIKLKSDFQSAKQNLSKQLQKGLKKLSQTNLSSKPSSTSSSTQQTQIKQIDLKQRFLSSSILLGFKPFSHIRQHPVMLTQRTILIESLQKFRNKKITRTHLLYQHNPRLALNFHAYIDNIPSYVVLLKLPNNNIIAAYSIPPLCSSSSSPVTPLNEPPALVQAQTPLGIMVCLQTRKSLTQQPQIKSSRPTFWDQYYIMFGNQELKIYVNNNKVQVFLGSVFGFYGPKIQQMEFCGMQGGEETNFLALQVHKVVFEGEEEHGKGKDIEMKQK